MWQDGGDEFLSCGVRWDPKELGDGTNEGCALIYMYWTLSTPMGMRNGIDSMEL